ncbi:MAG: cell division protein FtsA [Bacteroidales bacterium]|nr:cell division protein FtsA [Bacteroidales bacterium]
MDERYIAAVDLGSSKIAVTVAKIDGKDTQILYYRETPSLGVRDSAVLNPKMAGKELGKAIEQAESELKIKILQVVVGLPRYCVTQQKASAKIVRTDPEASISEEEIEYLKSSAVDSYPIDNPEKNVSFGVIAQSFSADDYINSIENDIVGMVSDTLEGKFKVFVGRQRDSRNIDKTLEEVGIVAAKKFFVPEITAKAVLNREEMDNGVALMEIGGAASSVTIYKGGILRYYASIPFGGKTITNDIKYECSCSEKLAENLKLAYGVCMPEKLQSLRDKIIQIHDKETGLTKQISVAYLSEIITRRLEEIIDALLWYVQESGLADKLAGGIVVTGGAAAMPNISSLIGEMSGYTVRIGYPRRKYSAVGCPGVDETSSATSIAMILAGKELEYLNCLDEAPRDEEEEIIPEEEPVDEAVEDADETAFDSEESGESMQEEPLEVEETEEEGGERDGLFRRKDIEASKEEKERIKAEKAAEKAARKAREAEERALRRRQKEEEQKLKEEERKKKHEELVGKFGIINWFRDKLDNLYDETSDF